PDALPVIAGPEGPVHHGPDAAIAIRGPAVRHRSDLLEHGRIVRATVRARGAARGGMVGRPPGHAQGLADRRDRAARHRPDPLRNHGLFFTISWAAWRISTSIVFRPTARSTSPLRPPP